MSAPALYTFLDNASLTKIERQRSMVIDQNSAGGRVLPIKTVDSDQVLWSVRDDVQGLMFLRGPSEPLPVSNDTGEKIYGIQPGRYGEMRPISEQVLEKARKQGTFADPLNVDEEIQIRLEEIAIREHALIEYIRWNLLVGGVVSVADKNGNLVEVARYTRNLVNAQVPWATVASAKPIDDFRALRDGAVGYGHEFGHRAVAFGTTKTFRKMLQNTNANDFGGRRGYGERPTGIVGLKDYNEVIAQAEDLPQLVAMDDGYLDTSGVFQRYIPDDYIVVVGYHWSRGLNAGNYQVTRNGLMMGEPGFYAEAGIETDKPPKLPWCARGHNGGPSINYTKQIWVLKVS